MTNKELSQRYCILRGAAEEMALNFVVEGYKAISANWDMMKYKNESDENLKQLLDKLDNLGYKSGIKPKEYAERGRELLTVLILITEAAEDLEKKASKEAEKDARVKDFDMALIHMVEAGDKLPDVLAGKEEEVNAFLEKKYGQLEEYLSENFSG